MTIAQVNTWVRLACMYKELDIMGLRLVGKKKQSEGMGEGRPVVLTLPKVATL